MQHGIERRFVPTSTQPTCANVRSFPLDEKAAAHNHINENIRINNMGAQSQRRGGSIKHCKKRVTATKHRRKTLLLAVVRLLSCRDTVSSVFLSEEGFRAGFLGSPPQQNHSFGTHTNSALPSPVLGPKMYPRLPAKHTPRV
jgi:hypothetical protein